MFLCDFHVHIYDCFVPEDVFDAAARNFLSTARKLRLEPSACFLFLTESGEYDWFGRLASGDAGLVSWQVNTTGEADSLVLSGEQIELVVVAGRQIVTSESIEVLSLCSATRVRDGMSLAETVCQVNRTGGIAVLPWGVGKWLGRRGRIIREFLLQSPERVVLGDNGGRPVMSPEPAMFRLARRLAIPVLPGSDALPIAGEEKRTAAYCGLVSGQGGSLSASWFRSALPVMQRVRPVGRRVSPGAFFRNQFRLRRSRGGA